MDWLTVKSQAELDAAFSAGKYTLSLEADIHFELKVPTGIVAAIKTLGYAVAKVLSGSVEAWGSSRVEAWESSSVEAWGSSRVVARGSSRVVARGSSRVEAWESSRVEAWESSSVEAWGSSRVEARGSSRVVARGSSRVEAWESSSVEAWGSSRVVAWAATALRLIGNYVSARASAQVAVHLENGAKCEGGVQIEVKKPTTPAEWCDWYGVEVKDDVAIVFKGVFDDYRSPRGGIYTPGTTPVASDWDGGKVECGGGLHFSPTPLATLKFNEDATKFVACPVKLSDMRPPKLSDEYPEKIKAAGCAAPVWEVDRFGEKIERAEEPIAKQTNASEETSTATV